MKRLTVLFAAVVVAVVLSSCGKVPQVEIDAANAAIEEAKVVGADVYVTADFAALQDSMRAINEQIEAQNAKLFKNFSKVKEQLVVVTGMAAETKTKTEARKEELKMEVETLKQEISSVLAQDNELVAQAPKGKEGAAALDAIKTDISLIEASLEEISTLVAAGQLIPAVDKAKASNEKALAIQTELTEVIEKYSKNKKK